ncbi:Silent information regulator protein Sir2 [Denitrovibrio acetiphilus DSM 12809]|uniref:protein acetyllysine N-acetyltransferase n=2 Tax=Denitrovibrio TaxID=117999 RepID=D4H6G7_DENA2|nr:Silent information regulator protein Sir2 [Denitrovibrio acetiphilus DSM 12809]
MDNLITLLKDAQTCLFLTSAGMSADSGIPTFRDRDGYWRNFPIFKEKGLHPQELASPHSFRTQAHHSWAFYEWRRRNARENTPHIGYEIINDMLNNYFKNAFVHTTNTDGYHLISGLDESKVMEVHGSIWRIQCMNGNGCRFMYEQNDQVPLCELDYETMSASDMPLCPHCSSLLRPNVLMFGDWEYVEHLHQYNNYRQFLDEVHIPDLIFLVGSSSEIPTNDYIAKSLQSHGAKVITINPDPDSTRVCRPDIYIQQGAAKAFGVIRDALDQIR